MPDTIMIVDDDRGIRYSLKRMFEEKGLRILTAKCGLEALELLERGATPDLALIDIVMPSMSGLDLFKEIKDKYPGLMVIMTTAHGTTQRAIRAMQLGAYDYILKPFEIPTMWETINKALQVAKTAKRPVTYPPFKDTDFTNESIVGDSLKMQEVYKTIGQVAGKDVNILISGESGTGKELVARAIYHHSKRINFPFISINCAAIPENLIESELFGHEKGSFTGAEYKRIGRFEQAHRGTIFLDEIGDMPIHVQAKILRVLQENEIQRVGGSETINVDVRLIAATNKNIEKGIKEGWFREDLFYRLNVILIHLPPLRERKEDIPLLVDYFLLRFSKKLQKQISGISPEAIELLINYPWPGNVRELENILKRAIILCKGKEILPENLSNQVKVHAKKAAVKIQEEIADNIESLLDQLFEILTDFSQYKQCLDIMSILERSMIDRAIRLTNGNKVQAASLLGINRNTLRNKMERYGLTG